MNHDLRNIRNLGWWNGALRVPVRVVAMALSPSLARIYQLATEPDKRLGFRPAR